jgi:hypothetical protein
MVPLILRKYFVRVAMLSQVGKLKRQRPGVKSWQIFTFIVWPQMLARIIQPLIGQSVILVKRVVGAIHYYGR